MIRVLVLYPRAPGKKFDAAYYLGKHLPLVKERLKPLSLEADLGVEGSEGPSPFVAVTIMTFASRQQLADGYCAYAAELVADKNRFTDIDIVTQIGEPA